MSDSPMSDEAKLIIWNQFLDLLPKTDHYLRKSIERGIELDNHLVKVIYDAAVYAGWCRGYAEGDGAHRGDAETPKRLKELRRMSGYEERQAKHEGLLFVGRPIEDMTKEELIEVCHIIKAEVDSERKRHRSTLDFFP